MKQLVQISIVAVDQFCIVGNIEVDTGRNLLISSQQDSDDYDYEKLSAAVDTSYDLVSKAFDAGSTLTQTKMSSEYASVKEQSGIKAGAGGFGVKVGEKTTLAGGVLSSSGDASTNRVETGRLAWSGIENRAAYSVSQVKLSGSLQGGLGKPEVYLDGDNSSSKTHSAVSAGTILIKDAAQQEQGLSDLRRDTINGHEVLAPIFDKERIQRRLEGVTLVKEIAEQTKQVLKNEARLSEQKRLEEAGWVSENGRTLNDEIDHRLKGSATGLGGSVDKAINMASSLVTGIISGNVTGGLAAGGAAYLATEIKNATLKRDDVGQIEYDSHGNPEQDKEAALLLHGILGGIVGYLTSGEGVSGAVGAIAGEVAADELLKARYPTKEIGDLTEEEKRELSRLASLVGGLAGVIATQGDIAGAKAGLETAQNAVENNALSHWMSSPGVQQQIAQAETVSDKLLEQCAGHCTLDDVNRVRKELGIKDISYVPEEIKNMSYLIPGVGLVYGVKDSLKEGEWAPMVMGAAGSVTSLASLTVKGTVMLVGVSMGANGSYQLVTKPASEFSVVDMGVAGVVGWLTQGKGIIGTTVVSGGGAGTGALIKGENPLPAVVGGAVGGAAGSVGGNAISNQLHDQIKKEVIGAIGGATISEVISDEVKEYIEYRNGKK